jgi:pyrimidine operon attenuation protein / uracil phosphoribosyltransferase
MSQVMNGEDVRRSVQRIAHEILETHRGAEDVVLVGIRTRGVSLAGRLAESISGFEGHEVPVGVLDVGRHRDDRPPTDTADTEIPGEVAGKHLVIVDDVLYTGRTVRAALDALTEIGRALSIELAVLVDRGHRELPVRADYVGKNLPTSREERVHVRLAEVDGEDGVWIEKVTS